MAKRQSTAKAPAFQFYPKDFLTDERQLALSVSGAGIYIRLLSHCWLAESLPNDATILAKMSACDQGTFDREWPTIIACFVETKSGRLTQKRLTEERAKQEHYRKLQQQKGLRSGAARAKLVQPDVNRGSTVVEHRPVQPQGNSSSSSSSSSSTPVLKNSLAPAKEPPDPRVKVFIEWFQVEYRKRRSGADYLVRWDRDGKLVKTMLKATTQERLEKYAVMMLSDKCEEPFIEESDRGIQILSTKFNWLSDRLAAWETRTGRTA